MSNVGLRVGFYMPNLLEAMELKLIKQSLIVNRQEGTAPGS